MTMTTTQAIITIAAVVLGTMATRFIPFIIFPEGKNPPEFIKYLGTVLPYAAIGLLVIYCLKDVPASSTHGLPEAIAIVFIVLLHKWKKNTLHSVTKTKYRGFYLKFFLSNLSGNLSKCLTCSVIFFFYCCKQFIRTFYRGRSTKFFCQFLTWCKKIIKSKIQADTFQCMCCTKCCLCIFICQCCLQLSKTRIIRNLSANFFTSASLTSLLSTLSKSDPNSS